ncbi:MAG: hypothetical protein ABL903_14900 [Methylococcales bacterium]
MQFYVFNVRALLSVEANFSGGPKASWQTASVKCNKMRDIAARPRIRELNSPLLQLRLDCRYSNYRDVMVTSLSMATGFRQSMPERQGFELAEASG